MTVLHRPLETRATIARPLSPAVADVVRALNGLEDGWSALIAPRLGLERPDLVVVHPDLGICAILVEEWSAGTRRPSADGSIALREIDGTERRVAHPCFEAARCRTAIYDRYYALPGDPSRPTDAVRAIVVLPRCTTVAARELLTHPVAEPTEREIAVWGGDALHQQINEIVSGGGNDGPSPASLDRFLAHVVEPAGDPAPPGTLTEAQTEVAENPAGHRIRGVRGPAGSGKSVALAARAAHLAGQGKQVLLLSFNVTMANHLSELTTAFSRQNGADPTRVTCANFHSFCEQIVDDAAQIGIQGRQQHGMRFADSIVAMAMHVYAAGFERRYDAVLVDEGQDYALSWWSLLRRHVVTDDGEMLLAIDPRQDLYGRSPWNDDEATREAGFDEPWIELTGSLRMAPDLTYVTESFVDNHLLAGVARQQIPYDAVDDDVPPALPAVLPTTRGRWLNINGVAGLGQQIGREVVRLLREQPTLAPKDVVFLCEYHHDGEAAVAEIEAAGYPVQHLFSRDPDDPRRGRRFRLWPGADAVKGCTVHTLKGWTTKALVMGIGVETRSKGTAYVSMTRVGADPGDPTFISIVNADRRLNDFGSTFTDALASSTAVVNAWDAPQADHRVG